jgi:alkylation response protein AidB-like acyl-CoA dehydrogenase
VELTSEQQALRESVAAVLERHPPQLDPEQGDNAAELWQLLSGIGVAGLGLPEQYGGAGAGPVEVSIVAEQLGRRLAPSPLLGSAVLTAQAILASGDTGACERLLPGIAAGDFIGALAWTGRLGRWDPDAPACHAASRSGGGWTITGTAHYVLDGADADVLIVAAARPAGQVGLFEVAPGQPGVDRQPVSTVDQTRRLATVRLAAAADRPLGPPEQLADLAGQPGTGALATAKALACIALSAEQVGAAARALELTVRYAKDRVQFGRPIASFQAIQHRLAELHVQVTSARSLSYRAASVAAASLGPPSLGKPGGPALTAEVQLLASAAKSYCSQTFAAVAAQTIQLHGAIGVTWEYDAHRYFKRAHGSAQLFGSVSAQLASIADAVVGPAQSPGDLDDPSG